MDGDFWTRFLYLGILLVLVLGWALAEYRKNLGQALRMILAWSMVIMGLMVGYGLWDDIRQGSSLNQVTSYEAQNVTLRQHRDGHFYADLTVNGTRVPFMVDTGATNIVLSKNDAQRIGIDLDNLRYFATAQTANGTVRTAIVPIETVEFGPFSHKNLRASVNDSEMEYSLLGMDYLRRFNIQIGGNQMVLSN